MTFTEVKTIADILDGDAIRLVILVLVNRKSSPHLQLTPLFRHIRPTHPHSQQIINKLLDLLISVKQEK